MVAAPDLARNLAGRQLGRYEVLTQLASGGMAGVYVARARGVAGFERLVAVKVLHPHLAYEEEFISMFLDEARLAARIRHPNVVPTLDISDTEGDGFFLVMEYIEGDHFGSLLGHAARGGERIPAGTTVRIVLDALAGLGAAHRLTDETGEMLQLVHRDVSPHNILVGSDGIARLTDFGVAKAEKRLSSTKAGQFKGKLAYMAPEQASTGHADQRSDLFSMGIILWEALTGRRLFRGENNASTLTKILHDDIPLPTSLWPDLAAFDDVLAIALDRDPDKRFQDAEAFATALEDAARDHSKIASHRVVSESVELWLGERINKEKLRVRDAIDHLGRSDYSEAAIPLPMEGSGSNITMSGRSRPPSLDSQTLSSASMPRLPVSASPASMDGRPDDNRRKTIMATAVVLLGLVVGSAIALMANGDSEVGTEASPSASTDIEGRTEGRTESPPDSPADGPANNPVPEGQGGRVTAEPDPTDEDTDPVELAVPTPPEATDEVDTNDSSMSSTGRRRNRNRTGGMTETSVAPSEMTEETATVTVMEAAPTTTTTTTTMRNTGTTMTGMDLEFNPYR